MKKVRTNPKRIPHSTGPLSPREVQVMTMVCAGKTRKEIAHALGTERSTVDTQFQRAQAKLGARTSEHAAVLFAGGVRPT